MIKDHDLSPLAMEGRTLGAHRVDLVCPHYVHRTGGIKGILGSILELLFHMTFQAYKGFLAAPSSVSDHLLTMEDAVRAMLEL